MSKYFGNEPDGWDTHETGLIGIGMFGNAVQVWTVMQGSDRVSVKRVAEAFKCEEAMVREAVEDHAWMFLVGDEIEHDGE